MGWKCALCSRKLEVSQCRLDWYLAPVFSLFQVHGNKVPEGHVEARGLQAFLWDESIPDEV